MAAPALASTTNLGSKCQRFTISQSGANQGSVTLTITRPIAAMVIELEGTPDSSSWAVTVSNDGSNFVAPITAITALTADGHARALTITTDGGWTDFKFTVSSAGASASQTLTVTVKYLA